MPAGPPAAPTAPLRSHWPAVLLAVLAALVAVWAHHPLYPAYSWNRDEPVYLWNVDLLRHGQLTATDGGHPDLFLPWLSAAEDGVMFTQYTLGWPLVLLVARLAHRHVGERAADRCGAGGGRHVRARLRAVAAPSSGGDRRLVARRVADPRGAGRRVPELPVHPGHRTGGGGAAALRGAPGAPGPLRGRRAPARLDLHHPPVRRAPVGRRVRPRSAAHRAVPAPRGLARASRSSPAPRHRSWWSRSSTTVTSPASCSRSRSRPPIRSTGSGSAPVVSCPASRRSTTASARRSASTAKNGFLLPWFLVGGYLGVVVALAGLWMRRREPIVTVTLLVAAVFPLGYFVFWGTYLSSVASRISGPIYLVPLYARGLHPRRRRHRPVVDRIGGRSRLAVLVILAVATVPGAITRFAVNREISEQQEPWRDSVDDADHPGAGARRRHGPYLLYSNPFSSNGPDLDGDVALRRRPAAPASSTSSPSEPERTPYLQEGSVALARARAAGGPLRPRRDHDPHRGRPGEAVRAATSSCRPRPGADVVEVLVDTVADSTQASPRRRRAGARMSVVIGGDGDDALAVR